MANKKPWIGFFLSLLTGLMWGLLPVSFMLLLGSMDTATITWYRFAVAAIVVLVFLWQQGRLPDLQRMDRKTRVSLFVAAAVLSANFILYLSSLLYLNPESAQVLIQLAPFILMFGSLFLYGERFGKLEWLGVVMLFGGFGLFFNDRLGEIFSSVNDYSIGIFLMVLASISWGTYGLLQKTLLAKMDSVQLTSLMYLGGVVFIFPFTSPLSIFNLNVVQFYALAFCSINLVLAYGAFTEALQLWDGAKVSAVITLAPLFTIISMKIAVANWPDVFIDSELNGLAYLGAVIVVLGSMLAALGHNLKGKQ
ncbi:MAG: DMT family transporter [Gammaproteobacteria bacterium]|nr:DMT family transporter [Gammaproteobacteria bacterium]